MNQTKQIYFFSVPLSIYHPICFFGPSFINSFSIFLLSIYLSIYLPVYKRGDYDKISVLPRLALAIYRSISQFSSMDQFNDTTKVMLYKQCIDS